MIWGRKTALAWLKNTRTVALRMDPATFAGALRTKTIVLTEHAKEQMEFRSLSHSALKNDLTQPPVAVEEQKCETTGERKFLAYYTQSGPHYHVYVVIINKQARVITAWRTNRLKQIDISKGRMKLFKTR